jgi:hypothetical protein
VSGLILTIFDVNFEPNVTYLDTLLTKPVMTKINLYLKSALNRCTVQPFTENDDTRCCENTICPPEDGNVNARNMSRIIV